MSEIKIMDGTGSGRLVGVTPENQVKTLAITVPMGRHRAVEGAAYNLNTGIISLTDDTESGCMYMKNLSADPFIITALAVGIGDLVSATERTKITMVRNPTSVSFSAAIDMNQNRNFGSSAVLDATLYKGAQGATVTGGDDIAIFYAGGGSRLFATIDFILTQATSIAIKVDVNAAAGADVYVALIGYVEESA